MLLTDWDNLLEDILSKILYTFVLAPSKITSIGVFNSILPCNCPC